MSVKGGAPAGGPLSVEGGVWSVRARGRRGGARRAARPL